MAGEVAITPAAVAQCRRQLAELERLHDGFGLINSRNDGDRRRDLLALRRELAATITDARRACDALFVDPRASALAATFRSLFSRWRSAVALHQANWPAVRIDEDPAAYAASAAGARTIEQEFLAWMGRVCAALEGKGVMPQP